MPLLVKRDFYRSYAVYVNSSKRMETAAGPAVNLDSSVSGSAGGFPLRELAAVIMQCWLSIRSREQVTGNKVKSESNRSVKYQERNLYGAPAPMATGSVEVHAAITNNNTVHLFAEETTCFPI